MSEIRFEQAGPLGSIVLCNPPDNQIGREWASELRAIVAQAGSAPIRALLIRAEGPNFGTGSVVSEWPGKDAYWYRTFVDEVNQSYRSIEALQIPTVAAVRGQASGGHFDLVLHCDLIVASETAEFRSVESLSGMVPNSGGLQRLAELVGRGRALEHVLFAEAIDGKLAGEIGLANRVVSDDEVDTVAAELAGRLANGPTLAHTAAKALLKAWSSGGIASADDLILDLTMPLFKSEDAQSAFAELKEEVEAGGDKADIETGSKRTFVGR